MANRKRPLEVSWVIPHTLNNKVKKPIAYSTIGTSHLIALLSKENETIEDVYNSVNYDNEAKEILKKYIDLGYGNLIARTLFLY